MDVSEQQKPEVPEAQESPEDVLLKKRLKLLGAGISRVSKRHSRQERASRGAGYFRAGDFSQALRLPVEFASGVLAGLLIGWLIDRTFATSPWGILIFAVVGFCTGMYNLLRATGHITMGRPDDRPDRTDSEQRD
ncbi:MAG: AtpZ/AtpI family protein [Methylobacteriaceae bacterium]|jgi:ATP synthase protein I|nr:AtpZ/AtpI family protein [Methylobacteriaceae bacterium]